MPSQPQEDHTLSPYTGYTRAHWEAAADALLAAVEPYASADGALYQLPGDRASWTGRLSDGLEGYARTLLLAAFRRDEKALARYADGLAAGVAGVWPRIEDRTQPLVEAASIAFALRVTRDLLWDRLDDAVQQRAAAWLGDALTAEPWPCNWELFPVTVGGFLEEIGHEPETARRVIDQRLHRIEQWYLGDGWYTDGDGRKFDYYNGWAMHLYPVLHAWLAQDDRLLARYGDRLSTHLDDYARLFGGDGAPLHQGRSLTYRFATTVPLWLGALTGRTPLSPGQTRRLASGALKYFLDRGAVDEHGLLSLGWHGPDSTVLQGYSGPASPYWASKGFLGLLLPPDHEVWTATEEPGPVESEDELRPVGPPNWLLQSTRSDGLVRLHNHGSEDVRYDPFYTRLAYSTVTRPVPLAEPAESYDNSVIVGGDASRTDIEPLGVGEGWAASRHTVSEGGVRVTSLVAARGAVEVRAHLVTGTAPGTPVRVTGWAEAEGVRCALHPAYGLSGAAAGPGLTGETADADATLFVALARLTADADPQPLPELVSVEVRGAYELSVHWAAGERAQFVFTASDERSSASSWSVTPR
ncbi:DUF2264 domain-containing protein [Streptomyces stelliscabiei]|uniref:DUF2264 domain-containing protein n=1 Tax=Streptomyces stelliscabiei TaxID=146820 RepID=UPI0029BF5036|nr:DUF2264 domain-containing protein [Streptomyces stelliscabiei]MDX2554994.1 DUF2264 domain-containing protein [Streptomyces stelliscabiei]MDX2611221.1 DUF2264 domain-containing protein [Streptomyces stelliscabiei]MDX2638894.1 DUF2264 domain-containing protein [Streptomyces stelliscabiei]MDX2662273.1 DUF2264 domain-containing protein [Streptomyces stelliscabiei]MDX2712747.1 DUF2264 domain-containing protein [Streptomyces stelliscabiei]